MTLIEKLSLFKDLSDEEKVKITNKFLADLSLMDEDKISNILNYLDSQRVHITKAKDIKVSLIPVEELIKKFDILSELHEVDLYRQIPETLCHNVIDIYRRIKYCQQYKISYKTMDGLYEKFIYDEGEWQKVPKNELKNQSISSESQLIEDNLVSIVPSIESVEDVTVPILDNNKSDNDLIGSNLTLEDTVPILGDVKLDNDFSNDNVIPISTEFVEEPINEIETETTNFADIRKQLQEQLKEYDNVISFDDIESETYEMRRAG